MERQIQSCWHGARLLETEMNGTQELCCASVGDMGVLDRGGGDGEMPLERATLEGRPAENADVSHAGIWGENILS